MINKTRIDFLKNYGKMIPVFSFMIPTLTPKERESYADNIFNYWYDNLGEYPKGIFTFMPDTYIVNYLHLKLFTFKIWNSLHSRLLFRPVSY